MKPYLWIVAGVAAASIATGVIVSQQGAPVEESINIAATPNSTPLPDEIAGCQVFPNAGSFYSPYVQSVASLPVNAKSGTWLGNYPNAHLHPNFGYALNAGMPINVVPQNQPMVPITFLKYPGQSDKGPYPIPSGAQIEGPNGGGDHHLIVVQEGTCLEYDVWQAAFTSKGWTGSSGAIYNLTTGARGNAGADAAWVPVGAGVIRCDEVAAGYIGHALNVVVPLPTQYAWIYPATHWNNETKNPDDIPMGARLRLKASFDTSSYTGQALTILNALQTYGGLVIDVGPNDGFQLEGETSSTCWNRAELASLNAVPVSAFDVIETGVVHTP